jgi:hypothetical protein
MTWFAWSAIVLAVLATTLTALVSVAFRIDPTQGIVLEKVGSDVYSAAEPCVCSAPGGSRLPLAEPCDPLTDTVILGTIERHFDRRGCRCGDRWRRLVRRRGCRCSHRC